MGCIKNHSMEVHRKAMDLNYFGTLNTIHAILPSMLKRSQGILCFVTTGAAMTSYIGLSTYSPSKYAIRGLADCLRNELISSGISVHIAFPGVMDTLGYTV
ncbi:3-dehydrosphinganine reductase [Aphanomyces cochlioides]|nr:3-dehydrosphinganine reductase [Aphanomyces cochlioides]